MRMCNHFGLVSNNSGKKILASRFHTTGTRVMKRYLLLAWVLLATPGHVFAIDGDCIGSLCFSDDSKLAGVPMPMGSNYKELRTALKSNDSICSDNAQPRSRWILNTFDFHLPDGKRGSHKRILNIVVAKGGCNTANSISGTYPWGSAKTRFGIALGDRLEKTRDSYGDPDKIILSTDAHARAYVFPLIGSDDFRQAFIYFGRNDSLFSTIIVFGMDGRVMAIRTGFGQG